MESGRQQGWAEANCKSDGDQHNPPIIRIHIAVHPNAKIKFGKTREGPDARGISLKLLSKLQGVVFCGFEFLAKFPGMDRGLAKRAAHDVLFEPTKRFVDHLFAARAGDLKRLITKKVIH